jgi:hypothetical protein
MLFVFCVFFDVLFFSQLFLDEIGRGEVPTELEQEAQGEH